MTQVLTGTLTHLPLLLRPLTELAEHRYDLRQQSVRLLHSFLPADEQRREKLDAQEEDLTRAILLTGGTFSADELAEQFPVVGIWMNWSEEMPTTTDGVFWYSPLSDAPRTREALAEEMRAALNADADFVAEHGEVEAAEAQLTGRQAWLEGHVRACARGEAAALRLLTSQGERAQFVQDLSRVHRRHLRAVLSGDPLDPGFGQVQRRARDSALLLWAAARGWRLLDLPPEEGQPVVCVGAA